MIPLGGDQFPTSPAELADALQASLRQLFALPDERAAVVVEGDNYPAAERLRIDLSGAVVAPRGRPPEPEGLQPAQPGPSFRRLEVVAHPLRVQAAALDLDLTAADARFAFGRDRAGRPWLVLTAARDGRFEARAAKRDIEALVQTAVRELAHQHGVEVEWTEFRLTDA